MTGTASLQSILSCGLDALQLDLPLEPLMDYLKQLERWNQAYNLTAVREVTRMATHHILDSLAILPWIQGPRILDVGSGAGLPGIPLALARLDDQFVLLDSNGKKTRFLQEVKRTLHLDNVEIVQMRAERYQPMKAFDTVVSRAFSDLQRMTGWTKHLVAAEGIWLAMKGRCPETELSAIRYPGRVIPYTVPGIEGERCCVVLQKEFS